MGATGHAQGRVGRWWSRGSVRAKSLFVVAIPMVALTIALAAFVRADQQHDDAQSDVAEAIEVRVHLASLLNLLVDAETGLRGFIITRDESYLAPFDQAVAALPQTLAELRAFVIGQDAERAALETLATRAADRIVDDERLLASVRASATADVRRLDEARADMEVIRADVAALDALQVARVDEARRSSEDADTRWQIALWFSIGIGIVGGSAAAMLFTRSVARRLGRLREDASRVGTGEMPDRAYPGHDDIDRVGRAMQEADRQIAEQTALREEREHRLQAVLDASPDPILVLDADTTVRSVSAAVTPVLGYSPADRVGLKAAVIQHPDDAAPFAAWIGRIARDEPTEYRMRYRIRASDGDWRWVEARARRLEGTAGEPTRVLLVSRDITAQRAMEQARREAAEAAETANRAKTEFLSRMSHELRTPLNAVLGFAQLLQLDDLDADQAAAVQHILHGGRHLLDLINEVLDISRIESGTLSLSPEPVLVSEVVTESVALMTNLAAERGVDIRIEGIEDCSSYVMADRQRFKQILLNLLSNAVKYNRPQGTVAISCGTQGPQISLTIADTGRGVPDADVDRLFVPFDRLGAEQMGIEGTGIGLSLARSLAEAMGGSVDLASTSSAGSSFVVTLPIVDAPSGLSEHDHVDAPTEHTAALPGVETLHTVVQIEDNPANVKLVEHVLSRRPGVRVLPALLGWEGIEVVREQQPDLVLLDLHLPDLDGPSVLRMLKGDPATADIPVVVVSADATPGQIHRVMALGAEAYLTKPFDIRELLAIVDRTCGRS